MRTASERAAAPGYVTSRRAALARSEYEHGHGPLPASGHLEPFQASTWAPRARPPATKRAAREPAAALFEATPC